MPSPSGENENGTKSERSAAGDKRRGESVDVSDKMTMTAELRPSSGMDKTTTGPAAPAESRQDYLFKRLMYLQNLRQVGLNKLQPFDLVVMLRVLLLLTIRQ